ncbi:LCP family protein [Sinosporangium siamense]|uniref:Cell envelope-related transcriptional attenuator domain-containing protein n=1 Tax=Sinosporangium siamense TaxID=1367973 RepID=A0A919RFM4_9ACTN|nr:LCP family protein [Sinosporangium siamense]GII91529.1 hypothetical protein Ssi02_17600 [Sinosporangium siamense]
MDDLKLLRELGHTLEHEPPASLVRQRRRLLDAAAGKSGKSRGAWLKRRAGLWAVAAALGTAVVTAVVTVVPTLMFSGGSTSVSAPLGGDRPEKAPGALNVLLVGTDPGAGTQKPSPAESITLVHLPENREKPLLISVPLDLHVSQPECRSGSGAVSPPRTGMINAAFTAGGLPCLWRAVESITRVRIDHALELDYSAFRGVVDALGGVDITLPRAIDAPQVKLVLPAGEHRMNGEQALGYIRLRQEGGGSDAERVKRQQVLIRSLVARAKERILRPAQLTALVEGIREHVKTDSFDALVEVATSLADLEPKNIVSITLPWEPHPSEPGALIPSIKQMDELLAPLRGGRPASPLPTITITRKPQATTTITVRPEAPR